MQIEFPEFLPFEDFGSERLQMLQELLGIESEGVTRARRYSLLLARPASGIKFAGRLLQIYAPNGDSVALARVAYERHVVEMLGPSAANELALQAAWLTTVAPNHESTKHLFAVVLMEPNRGRISIGLTENRPSNIEYIVERIGPSEFTLKNRGDYVAEMMAAHATRLAMIDAARRALGGNFRGLPA